MSKVHGHITRKGVNGTITQNGAFNWSYYWLTRYPSALTLTDNGELSITLNWTNNGTGYDGIKIERSADGVTYAVIATLGVVVTYTDTAPADGTFYYRIRYYKGTSYSAYSNIDSIAVESWNAALSTPSAVILTVISDTEIKVDFTINGTGQDGHKIYISTDGVNYALKGTVTGSTATYSATGLTAGTLYYFYVVAYKGSTESPASNIAYIMTEPTILRDSNTVAWYDFAVENIRKDGADNVTLWWDKIVGSASLGPELNSGTTTTFEIYQITATEPNHFYIGCQVGDVFQEEPAVSTLDANNKVRKFNGTHLSILTLTAAPVWTADGVVFDGVDACMRSQTFTYAQPQMVYLVMKQPTWTHLDVIACTAGVEAMIIQQRTSTPGLKAFGGTTTSDINNNLALDTWGIVRACFNGASSSLQVNNTAAVTGNWGSSAGNGIVLGGNRFAAVNFSNIVVKEAIFRSVADDATDQAKIYSYLSNKYGVG